MEKGSGLCRVSTLLQSRRLSCALSQHVFRSACPHPVSLTFLLTLFCPITQQTVEGYKLTQEERKQLSTQLSAAAIAKLEGHVREAALTRNSRLAGREGCRQVL